MVELNGTTNGIAAMVTYSNTKKRRFLVNKENKIRLFTNMKVATTVAKSVAGIEPRIEYYFILDEKQYPLSTSYNQRYGVYKFVDKDTNQIISVREKLEYRGSNFCYIVFENGDTNRCDKKYGYKRSQELFRFIMCGIEAAFTDNFDEYNISYTDVYRGEIVVHLKNCTGSIHIHTNSNLMDINQCRKEEEKKAFPFDKNMDKFTTFYTYISKDVTEPIRFNSEEKSVKLLNRIVEHLSKMDPEVEPKIVNVNCNGFVTFDE